MQPCCCLSRPVYYFLGLYFSSHKCVFQGLSYEPGLYIPFSLLRSDLLHACDFGLHWEILVHLYWFEIRLVTCRPSVCRPVLAVSIPNVPHASLAVLHH